MTKIIGILNYTANSFSDGGKHDSLNESKNRVEELFKQGADIVDIGVSATSYDAKLLSEEEEWSKLQPLLQVIQKDNISIDTYHYNTMKKAIAHGIKIINDVSGGKDERIFDLIASNPDVKYICMYSLVIPADRNIRIKSINEIFDWAKIKIDKCREFGIKNLILDPGIGFTTNAQQSLELLKNINKLQALGKPVCIGHSRKSFFDSIVKLAPESRDLETLSVSTYLFTKQVDYVRVHNVNFHKKTFMVLNKLY
ncbi:MAG: dihydropteroate synthase [Candidatus Midichloriaceae bacterium]|jgi:dihydropteroate synthase